MPATRLPAAPPAAFTIGFQGDVHHGLMHNFRRVKMADYALRTDSPLIPRVALWVQIGDIVDNPAAGVAQDDADAAAYWARYPDPKVILVGNHDVQGRSLAAHEAMYGLSAQNIDLGAFRFVTMNYVAGGPELAAAQAMIDADAKPVVLGVHFPPRDTVQAVGAPYGSVGTAAPYTYALQSSVDNWLRARIAASNNLKFVVHGHIHAWKHAAGLLTTLANGGNTVGSLNVGATSYMGSSNGDHAPPMYNYFLSMITPTSWEVRVRDVGGGTWQAIDPTMGKVSTVAVT